ncbi:hypothetical protein HBH92_112180 [Parastagonospora nodorum]|nr:hypothetical protein HBH92_112180 [Parastagonospora nodorum]KAH4439233.1 hypothetical protein HBH93_090620 [Parastagonospora nodorum]KAH4444664.1 hypothetical protein HBH91_148280 [Parastagonospora nodorum]KAH4492914.1 hypothetical protein HBH89_166400 [Parastagonospora nodorum]KAH4545969.1 hypothetical protein HBH85_080380 [Parastagonospora nodorum]
MAASDLQKPKSEAPGIGSALLAGSVTLEIGPYHLKYSVHKALLVYHSEYFHNALRDSWKEGKENLIVLEDVEPEPVNIFLHWLYTGSLPSLVDYAEWARIGGIGSVETQIKAYAFADRFLAHEFRRTINNNVAEQMRLKDNFLVSDILAMARIAFSSIPSDRPLLQLIVDEHCTFWKNCCEEPSRLTDFPPAFLARVTRRLCELLEDQICLQSSSGEWCYFEHADEAEMVACGKLHMQYDEEKDIGFFGKKILCENCWINEPSLLSSSGSDSSSDSESG